ncbi:Peroxisome biosynthesis protein pex1 [Blyttiomyces sp. JEL0837]|nr:Peroxisome biosynthesis protein pex1 [Blyttiomyces sp. JEL0837]
MTAIAVSLVPLSSCYVNLPARWVDALLHESLQPSQIAFKATWTLPKSSSTQTVYLGWGGGTSSTTVNSSGKRNPSKTGFDQFDVDGSGNTNEETIEIDAQWGRRIGLVDGQKITVEMVTPVPLGKSVNVEPLTEDDWEILELHAGYVEENFLSQVRVVSKDQEIAIWVHQRTMIRLRVCKLKLIVIQYSHCTNVFIMEGDITPQAPCVRLENEAEVIVAPKQRNRNPVPQQQQEKEVNTLTSSDVNKPLESVIARVIREDIPDLHDDAMLLMHGDMWKDETIVVGGRRNINKIGRRGNKGRLETSLTGNSNFLDPIWDGHEVIARIDVLRLQGKESDSDDSRGKDSNADVSGKNLQDVLKSGMDALVGGSGKGGDTNKSDAGVAIPHVRVIQNHRVPEGHVAMTDKLRQWLGVSAFSKVRLLPTLQASLTDFKVVLRKVTSSKASEPIVINSKSKTDSTTKESLPLQFLSWIEAHGTFDTLIITSDTFLTLGSSQVLVELKPLQKDQSSYVAGAWANLRVREWKKIGVEEGDPLAVGDNKQSQEKGLEIEKLPELGGFDTLLDTLVSNVQSRLQLRITRSALKIPSLGGILVHGNRGSGKTSLVKHAANVVSKNLDIMAYSQIINCDEMKLVKLSKIKETLQNAFDKAVWQAPSLIILENIDRIVPAETEGDGTRSRQISEAIIEFIEKYCIRRQDIAVIATAVDKEAVHKRLISSHTFDDFVHIATPNRPQRKEILASICKSYPQVTCDIDFSSTASATEGYLPSDLKTLVTRAIHVCAMRSMDAAMTDSETPVVPDVKGKGKAVAIDARKELIKANTERTGSSNTSGMQLLADDFDQALKGFVPAALKGVRLVDSGASWSDIGGLTETRRTLIETLEWPTKYAAIFATCPLRLRSGILLYGYPGCGKTLLASAVAKECGLNFISVKGPEILNKYIGASEKAIRDLFDRAQSAKPCILFFDEFESIAPRRGNDNTGVTDRVVNQMLTQMDGAEGLEGVYVLAATSRPDMIDPALLRPGRLDKSLLCGMPDLNDRVEILQAVSKKMVLSPEIDLRQVAQKLEGFSGADLQGLLYSANLEAIHENLHLTDVGAASKKGDGASDEADVQFRVVRPVDEEGAMSNAERSRLKERILKMEQNRSPKSNQNGGFEDKANIEIEKKTVLVKQAHIDTAIANTRPSVSPEEYARFSRIYAEFTGETPMSAKAMGKKTMMA